MPAPMLLRQPRTPRALLCTAVLALAADYIRVRRERDIARRPHRDPLTDLPLRDTLTDRSHALHARHPDGLLVVMADANDFKQINDTYGHEAGDQLIIAIADRLHPWAADHGGIAARLGGDEFAAVVPLPHHQAARQLTALADYVNRPVPYAGELLPLTAAIGAAHTADLPGRPVSDLMRAADTAMYRVKRRQATVPHLGSTADADTIGVRGRRPGRPGAHLPVAQLKR